MAYREVWKLSVKELHATEEHFDINRPQVVDLVEADGGTFQNAKRLLYFQNPEKSSYPLDLNEGFDSYICRRKAYNDGKIQPIEYNFIRHKWTQSCEEAASKARIYTRRRTLWRIMITPYRMHEDWTLHATKFNDVIYLRCHNGEPYAERNTKNDTYHFKYCQYCFFDTPHAPPPPATKTPIDENKQIHCVFRTQLEDFEILYASEISGIESASEITDLTNMEEINKCRFVLTKLMPDFLQRKWQSHPKVLLWWLQAYLAATDDIYLGFKSKTGIVYAPPVHLNVQKLPKGQKWKPHICIGFLHKYFNIIKQTMANVNCPYTSYEFRYVASKRLIDCKIHEGKTQHSFFTEEFIEQMHKK